MRCHRPFGQSRRFFARGINAGLLFDQRAGHQPTVRARVELAVGGEIEIVDAGGGGFGGPAERCVEAIAADLADGRITRAFAAENYPAQLAALEKRGGTVG